VADTRRSRSPTRSPRRKTSWIIGPRTGANGSLQSIISSVKTVATIGVTTVDGETLIRTRGQLLLFLRSATASNNGFTGAFGIGMVTDQAFTAGIASMPGPLNDDEWDGWLYHNYFAVFASSVIAAEVSNADDFANTQSAVLRMEIDSKAMRKTKSKQVMFAALEVEETGVADMSWFFNSRQLFKLP